jgi:hypothetical protein
MDNQTLKNHEEALEEHDSEICHIRQDLIDIKTRLGIKDLTNGQVVEYQKQLADAIALEREERKAMDEKLDDRTWFILTGIIISILIEIGFMLFRG